MNNNSKNTKNKKKKFFYDVMMMSSCTVHLLGYHPQTSILQSKPKNYTKTHKMKNQNKP